jgi:hypothetical protein
MGKKSANFGVRPEQGWREAVGGLVSGPPTEPGYTIASCTASRRPQVQELLDSVFDVLRSLGIVVAIE